MYQTPNSIALVWQHGGGCCLIAIEEHVFDPSILLTSLVVSLSDTKIGANSLKTGFVR